MDRRKFLRSLATLPLLSLSSVQQRAISLENTDKSLQRVRPGDPGWPSEASWDKLRQQVKGRMVKLESPLNVCQLNKECTEVFTKSQNPYYISNEPSLTQTFGWADAWTSAPSVYAIEAGETTDVVAAINFARNHNLRLVVKGGAHSYQGRSSSEDSLLIWTRKMNDIALHDAFVPQGCSGNVSPQPGVSIGAGAIWMDAYDAVTTKGGRYVQGGGCTTVGVAGLIQSGGFGSFSKKYGLVATGLLEAEVVTAEGEVRIANSCRNPDLFWALKGGGGGSFGVVTRVTLRTRELPQYFGGVFGKITADSNAAFHHLVAHIMEFYQEKLFNPHWGEQIRFSPGNSVGIQLVFQGLSRQQAREVWQPFQSWVADQQDIHWEEPLNIMTIPARRFWDTSYLQQNLPGVVVGDDRPDARPGDFFWAGDQGQAGQYLHGFRSAWLPASLLEEGQVERLSDALVDCSRHWGISLHFNKGLAGAPANERQAAQNTAVNPEVVDAFALAIVAGEESQAFPGIPGHEPDMENARRNADSIDRAMRELLKVAPRAGSYISESNYFEENWQQSFWGANYARLVKVKKKYDSEGLFFIHHGVGSEEWTDNGFTKKKNAER